DLDPDVATVNIEKRLTLFINERFASFRSQAVPEMTSQFVPVETVAAADIDGNGVTDFVFSTSDNQIFQLSSMDGDNSFQVRRIAIPDSAYFQEEATNLEPGEAGLFSADLDNNGSLDIVNSHVLTDIYLGSGNSVVEGLPKDASRTQGSVGPVSRVYAVVDVNGDGRLDLVGLNNEGSLFYQINRGTKNYHYQVLRTRAAKATGDQRINSFGIGGEIEIRSGLLTQKQVITSPILHFGLGENTQTDVARIIWPNGSVQAEFELEADQSILAEQRLKGSCPMLFAWDGKQISYVKDTAPWSPALGLHVNAQVVAGIYRTEEWFKIRGDQLVPRDGIYDLRVTAELWETYYIDHYSLMVVDHPVGTEVFVDERFAVPPPPLKLHATGPTKPFARARDDLGQDVSAVVCDLDAKYLDTFGKGRYQGVTRDHWVELELPADAPHDKPLYLIGHGFVQPTDGSINIAYSQTGYPPPQGLTIETPDADGRWTVAKSGKGFPAGKLKTVVLDMDGIFHPGAPRRLRLRTNMEI